MNWGCGETAAAVGSSTTAVRLIAAAPITPIAAAGSVPRPVGPASNAAPVAPRPTPAQTGQPTRPPRATRTAVNTGWRLDRIPATPALTCCWAVVRSQSGTAAWITPAVATAAGLAVRGRSAPVAAANGTNRTAAPTARNATSHSGLSPACSPTVVSGYTAPHAPPSATRKRSHRRVTDRAYGAAARSTARTGRQGPHDAVSRIGFDSVRQGPSGGGAPED